MQGLAWGLVSGFTFALLAVLNRRWAGTRAGDRHRVLAERSAPRSRCCRSRWASAAGRSATIGAREIVLLVVLGLVCTALAHTLFIAALRRVTAHTASVVAALEPVYGIALALAAAGRGARARARSRAAR